MKRVCAWCKVEMGEAAADDRDTPITHGICRACAKEVMSFKVEPLSSFLDEFDGPVFVLNDELEIISANSEGARLLGRDLSEFSGEVAGRALGCKYSFLEGGCGRQEHCLTCTIRNSITRTIETGESCRHIEAFPDLIDEKGRDMQARFRVTTEKLGPSTILKIEDLEDLA